MSKHVTPSIGPSGQLQLSQVEAIARACRDCPVAYWETITGWLKHAVTEAEDWATHPDTPEDKRAGWCGRQRGLRDILRDLEALRSGSWREWYPRDTFTAEEEPEPVGVTAQAP